MDLAQFYVSAAADCRERLRLIRRKTNAVSLLRLTLFGCLALSLWYLFRSGSAWLPAAVVTSLAAFVASVNWYFRLKDQRLLWEKLVFVNENEKGVLDGRENAFPDGAGFLDQENYLDDLDVFGPASVFHALNRTTTFHGTGALADLLGQSLLSPAAILGQQQAVKTLAKQPDLRRLLTAKGLLAGEGKGDLRTLSRWLNMTPVIYPLVWLRILLPVLTLANVAILLYSLSSGEYIPLVAAVIVDRLIVAYFGREVSEQQRLISHKQEVFAQYADILAVFSGVETGNAPVPEQLRLQAREAHGAIRRLSRLTSFFDQRMNLMVNLVLNSLAFYDLQCMVGLERWKRRNKEAFPGWVEAVGQIEVLNSMATFAFNHPDYVWPSVEIAEASETGTAAPGMRNGLAPMERPGAEAGNGLFIDARQMGHPLIPAKRRIDNDFRIGREERLILVTGSNMAGKTTFLRTIGVNLLLAQCGAPVCAATFSFTPMQLLTSLRISDSLQEQTSYFMAELKKLQRIVLRLETGAPTLVLIDEILRGTNSEDKNYGSDQFARKLTGYHCLSLFATHDLALGQLEAELPGIVANYCFESVIEGGDLIFNYRLQRGIARNRNASFLMKKMKII